MREIDFDGLLGKVGNCSLEEYKEILGTEGLTESMKAKLGKKRRTFETPQLTDMIKNSDCSPRTVYELSITQRINLYKGLNYYVEKAMQDGYFYAKELIEETFGQTARDMSDSSEFSDECALMKYFSSEGMIVSHFKQYTSGEKECLDALVTKNGKILMQFLHSVSSEDDATTENYYILSPECSNFDRMLDRITVLTFTKRKTENVEKDQPRENIFCPYISKNSISIESLESRDPIKAAEADNNLRSDLLSRSLTLIIRQQDRGNYKKVDELVKKYDSQVLKLGKSSAEGEQFELDKARIDLSYALLSHYLNSEGWNSRNTQILYKQIQDFEGSFDDVVRKMGYDPIKRKIDLLL
jgi:hypothetical protein